MSRVDIPTLQCDRCKQTTQDLREMAGYQTLQYYPMSGRVESWDLCPVCWKQAMTFLDGGA